MSIESRNKRLLLVALLLAAPALLAGCAVRSVHRTAPQPRQARWALLPLLNHSQTPQAGQRAEAILETLLRANGIPDLEQCPPEQMNGELPELRERRRLDKGVAWARKNRFRYGVTGSVEEWRYRGLDGQPAAGLTVRVIDLDSGKVVFSAAGAKAGWGRDTISGVAQNLLEDLTSHLRLQN